MPQALAAVFVSLGVSTLVATVAATVIFVVAASFISGLLNGNPSSKSERTERSIKHPTPPRNRAFGRRRLFGAWMLFDTAGGFSSGLEYVINAGTTVDVWAFHDGRANAILQAYLNDEEAEVSGGYVQNMGDGAYGGNRVRAGWNLGLPTETAFAPVIDLVPDIWTENHRGDGIVSGYLTKRPVKSEDFIERFPQGDNVVMSLAGEWRLCFDPRDESHDPADQGTWTYTENAALHLLTFKLADRGEDYATKLEPVIADWISAADHCDEAMALSAGGSEPRYRGCVAYELTALPGEVESELLACFDGWCAQDEHGRWRVFSGRVTAPTVSIGPDEIVAYSHQSYVEDENYINELIVHYVSDQHKFDTVECQPWRDEADITERGRVNSDGFSPQVPSHTQARRLAKRSMARRNAPNRGTVTTNIAGRAAIGQRYVNLRLEEAGAVFFDGIAEIIGGERDFDTGGFVFEWVEADPAVDEWNAAAEDGEPAPNGTRVAREQLTAPTITTAAFFGTDNSGSGQSGARIRLTVSGPNRDDLTWFVRWRNVGVTEWGAQQQYGDVDPGESVTLETGFVPADGAVEVQAAYRVGDGRLSPWSAPFTVDTTTPYSADTTLLTADTTAVSTDRG